MKIRKNTKAELKCLKEGVTDITYEHDGYDNAKHAITRMTGTREAVFEDIFEAQVELAFQLEEFEYIFEYIAYLEETHQYDHAIEVAYRLVNYMAEIEQYDDDLARAVDIIEHFLYESNIELEEDEYDRLVYLRGRAYC